MSWVLVLATLRAAMPAAVALFTGFLLSAIQGVLTPGGAPPGADARLAIAIGIMLGAFVAMRLLAVVNGPLMNLFIWRIQARLRAEARHLASVPRGIGHLERSDLRVSLYTMGAMSPYSAAGAAVSLVYLGTMYAGTLGALGILARFSPWLALGLIAAAIGLRSRFASAGQRLAPAAQAGAAAIDRAQYGAELVTSARSTQEVRLFNLTEWLAGGFRAGWLSGKEAFWREQANIAGLSRWIYLAIGAIWAATLALLVLSTVSGHVTVPELGTYTAAMSSVLPLLSPTFQSMMLRFGMGERAAARKFAGEVEAAARAEGPVATLSVPPTGADIAFEGVSFAYPGGERPVLQDFDLVIPAGRVSAIVGANGAGKSTVINLVTQMYQPVSGRVLAGGEDLRHVDPALWRARLAVVFQDFARFPLSLGENIGIAATRSSWDEDEVTGVLAEVGLAGLPGELPAGLGTSLRRDFDNGTELSGGQWQRVCIARALLALDKGAEVLILDEPTANLDVRGELEIFEHIIERCVGKTVLLVSHRFSTVRRADHIVVLGHGRVMEQGSHEELLERHGRYARMFNLQAVRFHDKADLAGEGAPA